jgi:hypothetical protein
MVLKIGKLVLANHTIFLLPHPFLDTFVRVNTIESKFTSDQNAL